MWGAAYDGGLLSLEGSMSAGIYCGGRVTIDGCEVTAIGGETDSGTSRGLYSEQDDIAVNDSAITATADRAV